MQVGDRSPVSPDSDGSQDCSTKSNNSNNNNNDINTNDNTNVDNKDWTAWFRFAWPEAIEIARRKQSHHFWHRTNIYTKFSLKNNNFIFNFNFNNKFNNFALFSLGKFYTVVNYFLFVEILVEIPEAGSRKKYLRMIYSLAEIKIIPFVIWKLVNSKQFSIQANILLKKLWRF